MTPLNYHLFTAYNDWLVENNKRIEICVSIKGLDYPFLAKSVFDEKVILNITPRAVKDFSLSSEFVCFEASFNKVKHYLEIPMRNVLAFIYEHEGLRVALELPFMAPELPPPEPKKPTLTVVK